MSRAGGDEASIKALHDALVQPSAAKYEALRKELIDALGYDKFFDLQHEAFLMIASNA